MFVRGFNLYHTHSVKKGGEAQGVDGFLVFTAEGCSDKGIRKVGALTCNCVLQTTPNLTYAAPYIHIRMAVSPVAKAHSVIAVGRAFFIAAMVTAKLH